MKVTIDLLSLIGAEPMERNRVPGVFIPLVPNAKTSFGKKGMSAFVSFSLYHTKKLKNFDMCGSLIIPEEHKDRYLESDTLLRKHGHVVWAWNKRSEAGIGSSIVSREDFESLIGD